MAIISNANLQSSMDKLARFVAEANGQALVSSLSTYAKTAPNAGLLIANSDVWSALTALIAALADSDQKSDLLPVLNQTNEANPIINGLVAAILALPLASFDFHCAARSGLANVQNPSALDAYLTSLNAAAPTLRVHGALLLARRFSPSNTFTPDIVTIGTVSVTGASSGTYTHGTAMDQAKYAPGQVMLQNTKSETSTNTGISATCVKPGGTTANVTFTAGGAGNNLLTAGSDTGLLYVDVSAITVTGNGTSGDTYAVVVVPDRTINAA